MNMQGFQGLAVLAFLFGIFTTILWLVIGWRAMRAHEKIADSVEWLVRQNHRQEQQPNSLGDD
jgi:uncharacterized membrane protein